MINSSSTLTGVNISSAQALCEAHASRASGISALHAVGGELLFSHTDVVGRKVRALRLLR